MNDKNNYNDVLVIGAGIAGIEASLSLSKADRKVHLIERTSYTGGNVIKFEEVFSNMECSTCMISPRQQDLLQDKNVTLTMLAEIKEVKGSVGNFTVKIHKKARYVDLQNCIGCNACFEPCPVSLENEFEEGLSKRKAIYIPCAGALPNVPMIDTEHCLRFNGESCQACQEACAFEAIDFNQKDENLELKVGAILVATGFNIFDPREIPKYGYGKFENVYTSFEFERLYASNGPTEGKIILKDGKTPKSAAIIHCVGRDEVGYCSSVCCMYSLKFARYLKDKILDIKVSNFYSDLCIPGKLYQAFYDNTRAKDVEFIRSKNVKITKKDGKINVMYSDENGKMNNNQFDMVILSPAIKPAENTSKIANVVGIAQDDKGFFAEEHEKLGPVSTSTEGVYIIGSAQGPKNIPETIVQSEAASGKILSSLIPGRKIEPEVKISHISESFCTGCKTCISVCPYGVIDFDESRKISVVNEIICRGCGNCVAACPSGAITLKHFTFDQIYQELMEAVR